MSVVFADKENKVRVERVVRQEGRREIFNDDFILADSGTFNVLKSVKPYTELDYIESTGTQYIDLSLIHI